MIETNQANEMGTLHYGIDYPRHFDVGAISTEILRKKLKFLDGRIIIKRALKPQATIEELLEETDGLVNDMGMAMAKGIGNNGKYKTDFNSLMDDLNQKNRLSKRDYTLEIRKIKQRYQNLISAYNLMRVCSPTGSQI